MAVSRRAFLGSSLLLSGCAIRRSVVPMPSDAVRLAPVQVSADRVIRVTTGLRPFRPSGFRVQAEKFDDKLVIHNYGHGGAGITLSWGTADLAVQEAIKGTERECAVIGCGVVGLATARLLQQRGFTRWLPVYHLSDEPPDAAPLPPSPMREIDTMHPDSKQLDRRDSPFDKAYASRQRNMLIEPSIYLAALVRDFELAGGRIVIKEFASAAAILALPQKLIFNCTGLGARTLFNDEELIPIKGQLVFLLPQPEVEYMTIGPGDIYMFPGTMALFSAGLTSAAHGIQTRTRMRLLGFCGITESSSRECVCKQKVEPYLSWLPARILEPGI